MKCLHYDETIPRRQHPVASFRRAALLVATALLVLDGSTSVRAAVNGIDRISPGTATLPDEYFLAVDSGSPTASFTETGISPLATFDGIRDISLDVNGGTGAFSSKLQGDTFLSLENDANTSSILTLDYGAQGDLNRNFLFGGGFNAIAIKVAQVNSGTGGLDLGSGTFTLTLRSGSVIRTAATSINFNSPGDYFFLYQDPGFVGINFAHVDEVTLGLTTTTPGTDFRIASIYRGTAVPEPSTYALLVIGAAGFLVPGVRRCARMRIQSFASPNDRRMIQWWVERRGS